MITVVETALIGLFLDITPKEMANPRLPIQSQAQSFDSKVIELKNKGLNMLQIAKKMNVHHQIISNILKGIYEINKPQGVKYKPSKWDWEKIDNDCVSKLPSLIEQLKSQGYKSITKKLVSQELGLKDTSLRNLPRLKKMIKQEDIMTNLLVIGFWC